MNWEFSGLTVCSCRSRIKLNIVVSCLFMVGLSGGKLKTELPLELI